MKKKTNDIKATVSDLELLKANLRMANSIHENIIADDFIVLMDNTPFLKDYVFDTAFSSETNHHILLIHSGWVKHSVGYSDQTVKSKSVVFIPAGLVISIEEYSKDFRASVITFKINDLELVERFLANDVVQLNVGYSEYNLLLGYFSLLNNLASAPSKFERDFDFLVLSLVMHIKNLENMVAGSRPVLYANRRQEIATDFLKLLNGSSPHPRKIGDYAKRLEISENYLSAVVKEITGRTVMELVDNKSLELIKRSLGRKSKPRLKDLAMDLGFSSVPQLIRFFKRHTGQTPGEFRKEVREKGGQRSKVKGQRSEV